MKTVIRLNGKVIFNGDKPKMRTNDQYWDTGTGKYYRVRHVSEFVQHRETSQEVDLAEQR